MRRHGKKQTTPRRTRQGPSRSNGAILHELAVKTAPSRIGDLASVASQLVAPNFRANQHMPPIGPRSRCNANAPGQPKPRISKAVKNRRVTAQTQSRDQAEKQGLATTPHDAREVAENRSMRANGAGGSSRQSHIHSHAELQSPSQKPGSSKQPFLFHTQNPYRLASYQTSDVTRTLWTSEIPRANMKT